MSWLPVKKLLRISLKVRSFHFYLGFSTAADKGEEGGTKWKSIHDKLIDLYLEYCASMKAEIEAKRDERTARRAGDEEEMEEEEEDDDDTVISPPANLLGILVDRERLNTLVLKLYPGNGGYALVLKGKFNFTPNEKRNCDGE